ncbi:hypothetical protein ACHHYP_20393 [Achlya hypogyna]|uniref:Uncharacterized protein n=1 Tax=Achlya hypogyna TaxID=1202772 RepID=A0A1V9ZK93_ACHHY|nr:hypothetical protein ACHHYP_20393 [Achlya hypogyna]
MSAAITIANFAFNPQHVTLPKGSTVTWVHANPHAPLHSITSVGGDCDSPELVLGQKHQHFFASPGTFKYYCHRYSFMQASITITDSACEGPREPVSPVANARGTSFQLTMTTHDAFVHAASLNQTSVLERWISKGLDVDGADSDGHTALCMAATNQCVDAMQLLVANGAHVRGQQAGGQTALHCACTWGRLPAVDLLIAHSADVNARDANKRVPLHCASRNGHLDVVRHLLAAQADPYLADECGNTPFQVATAWKRLDVLEALEVYSTTTFREDMRRRLRLAVARVDLPTGVLKAIFECLA